MFEITTKLGKHLGVVILDEWRKISVNRHNNEETENSIIVSVTDFFEKQTLAFAGGKASLLKQIRGKSN